jgi:hypothetical protein
MPAVGFDARFFTGRPDDRLFMLFRGPCRPVSGYNKIGNDRFLPRSLELI